MIRVGERLSVLRTGDVRLCVFRADDDDEALPELEFSSPLPPAATTTRGMEALDLLLPLLALVLMPALALHGPPAC